MALPASGYITLTQISDEVFAGLNVRYYDLVNLTNAAFGGPPYNMTRFYGYSAPWVRTVNLYDNIPNFNARDWCVSQGWDQVRVVVLTIHTAGTSYATAYGVYALRSGSPWPAGSYHNLYINAYNGVYAIGGTGGKGGLAPNGNGEAGVAGFHAIALEVPTNVWDKVGSVVCGGGGGGGGGGGAGSTPNYGARGGGGGGGCTWQAVAGGQPGDLSGGWIDGGGYAAGQTSGCGGSGCGTAGAGGSGGTCNPGNGGTGGVGGFWGTAGATGGGGQFANAYNQPGGAGGAAGYSFINWYAFAAHQEHSGTFYGPLS